MADWRVAVLKRLGYKPTKQNLSFLDSWQRWEGGHTNNDAKWNWLNTTRGKGRSINSVGVKAFGSFGEGVQNTVATLRNGRYGDILEGLASGDPYTHDVSAGLQTWVSGSPTGNPGYAQKVLGRKVSGKHTVPVPGAKLKLGPMPDLADDSWGYAMSLIFDDDPELAGLMTGLDPIKKDAVAQKKGIVDPGGSLNPVDLPPGDLGALLSAAQSQLGKPYVFGSGPDTKSFDCSDLIQWAYGQIGIHLPRVTYDQIKVGRSVKGKPLRPGDLIFPHAGHVVMYVGNGKVIAAPHTGTVVQYQDVPSNYLEARRVIG